MGPPAQQAMFGDSGSEYSYLEETEQALLDLQRQLQPWLAQQTQRVSRDSGRVHSMPERLAAKAHRHRRPLDRLPRHARLSRRTSTLGLTLEELDDMGLLDGGSIPPYFRSMNRRERREMDMRRRSARRRVRAQERKPHTLITVNHMLRVLERRGVNVVAHFRSYDQQARGTLTRQKFAHALHTLGLPLSSSDIGRLIADFAADEAQKHVSCFALLVDANILPRSSVGQQAYLETTPSAQQRQQFDVQADQEASEDSEQVRSWTSGSEVTMLVQEVRAVTLQVVHALRKTAADVYGMFAASADVDGYVPAAQFFRILARLHVRLSEDQQSLFVELFGDETMERVQFEDFVRYVFDTGPNSSLDDGERHVYPHSPVSSESHHGQEVRANFTNAQRARRPLSAMTGGTPASGRNRPLLRPLTASARVSQSGWTTQEQPQNDNDAHQGHKRVASTDWQDDFIYEEPSDDGSADLENLQMQNETTQQQWSPDLQAASPFAISAQRFVEEIQPERTQTGPQRRPETAGAAHVDRVRQRRRSLQSARSPARRSPDESKPSATPLSRGRARPTRPHSAGACPPPKFSLSGNMSAKLSAQAASTYGSFAYIPILHQQPVSQDATLRSGTTDHEATEDLTSDSHASRTSAPETTPHASTHEETLHQLRQLIQERHSPDRPLRWIFRHFDRKKRNFFDRHDLAASLCDLKLDYSRDCVDYLMTRIAIDDGEQVSLGEFVVFVTDAAHRQLSTAIFTALAAQLESQGRSFYGGLFDVLGGGTTANADVHPRRPSSGAPSARKSTRAVSKDTFVSGLLSLCKQLTAHDAERLAVRFDVHGSGFVSLGRFWKTLSNSPQWKAAEELLTIHEEALEQGEIVKHQLQLGETEPDVTNEVVEMAVQLGVRLLSERQLLWVVKKALECELPEGWTAKRDRDGRLYYFNRTSGDITWQHPLRDMFVKLVCEQRKELASTHTTGVSDVQM